MSSQGHCGLVFTIIIHNTETGDEIQNLKIKIRHEYFVPLRNGKEKRIRYLPTIKNRFSIYIWDHAAVVLTGRREVQTGNLLFK